MNTATASANCSPSQIRDVPVAANIARETDLIKRVISGDTEVFYDLIKPYERTVFFSAASILGNHADAEEVAQEAILKAYKNLASFRQESKFSTWLIQIVINEARLRLRKDRRHLFESIENGSPTEDGDYIPTDFADWRPIPSEALEHKEMRESLRSALEALPEKYRTVLILRDMQQLSIAETAQLLGLTEENVKTRTSRARLQMRDRLTAAWRGPSTRIEERTNDNFNHVGIEFSREGDG